MTFSDGRPPNRLERIMGFASTTDGASHLASIADILVGSWRYCVNEPEMDIAGKAMFPKLMDLMWKRTFNGKLYVRDFGIVLRPQEVQVEKYKKEYDSLRAAFKAIWMPSPPRSKWRASKIIAGVGSAGRAPPYRKHWVAATACTTCWASYSKAVPCASCC